MHICRLMYYNCVKFHKNSISSLVGVALTMYIPPFHESVSWIISPFKFWTATIFLHAHLQVVYYKCVKFHKNPISRLGEVALTRYMDGRTDRQTDGRTDGQSDSYIPPKLCLRGVSIYLTRKERHHINDWYICTNTLFHVPLLHNIFCSISINERVVMIRDISLLVKKVTNKL
jgi:hypothetical protein